MGIEKNVNKWIVFLVAFFIAAVFNSYDAQAETNSNVETIEVDEMESTKDTEERYMGKEEVEKLLKENSQEYELKLMEYKLEAQSEKNGVLQGNIGTILSLLGIIIAVIVAILGIVWKWFESRIKINISSSLQDIQNMKTTIEGITTEIRSRHTEINESYKKIKDLEEDVQKSNVNYKNFNLEKIELDNSINGIKQYAKYLEARCQEVEWASKFFAQQEMRNHVIKELKNLLETKLTTESEQTAIIKFKRKHGNNFTDDDSKLSNIYDYYVKRVKEEEGICLKEIKVLGDFDYIDYLQYIEEGGDYESEIERKYNDWDGYMSDLEDMLEIVKAVIAMNGNHS
ncbi:hypothetical protein [Lysinibacillus capsici]|uniref:hypothetical protein n=1 Tax=Lysinibacillus capsici TaxID=2115968 RepID=UPI003D0956CA